MGLDLVLKVVRSQDTLVTLSLGRTTLTTRKTVDCQEGEEQLRPSNGLMGKVELDLVTEPLGGGTLAGAPEPVAAAAQLST